MASADSHHTDVQDYYGKKLNSSSDLKTTACCTRSNITRSERVLKALSLIHQEVSKKYYGCGLVFPEAIEGCHMLDLGCGSGRDCYVLSQLVGENGFVTGVDMTREQIEVAIQYIDYHTKVFGYAAPNVVFKEGLIEDVQSLGIAKESVDVIISNCVLNLCPDKQNVLKDAFAVLKKGGEMYFSDIYTDLTLPPDAKSNKILHGECIAGALEWRELMSLACQIGFAPPVLVDVSPVTVKDNLDLESLLGESKFCSATYRLFKVSSAAESLDCVSEAVTYKGTIADFPKEFKFSFDIVLPKETSVILPSSVAQLIKGSRLVSHFTFTSSSVVSQFPALDVFVSIDPFEIMSQRSGSIKSNQSSTCCC